MAAFRLDAANFDSLKFLSPFNRFVQNREAVPRESINPDVTLEKTNKCYFWGRIVLFYYVEHAQHVFRDVFLGSMPARRMFIDSPAWKRAHVWGLRFENKVQKLVEFSL